jgi:lipopolysaccharide transport system permease protein
MSKLQVVTHIPPKPLTHPFHMLRVVLREIVGARHVAWEMMTRDLRSQYRTSVVGVLIPHLINVGTVDMPYPFFVLCGMMLWAAFLESMDAPIMGVQAEQGLLSKANIPPEAVTIARLGQVTVNFGVKAVLIAIGAVVYQVHVPWTIIFAPLGLLLIMGLGAAIGLIVAPINLLYTDVAKALPILTTFWFFTTPIIFTAPTAGWAAFLMRYVNPMTPLLTSTRELAFGAGLSLPRGLGAATALTLCLLVFGTIFHRIARPIVIDRANA